MSTRESIQRRIQKQSGLEVPQYDKNDLELASNLFPTESVYSGTQIPDFKIDEYTPYLGENYNPLTDTETRRSKAQSTGAKILGTLNKALIGEVVGGTLEGIGHFGDIPQTINALEGETQEWGNWLTDLGQGMRTWAEEATPVYIDPANQGKFNPWTADWWYNNAPSMASTLSLMIPAAGVVRGASLLGKAMGIAGKMGKTAKFMATGIGQATASRLMENGMEALGNYDQTLQELLAKDVDEDLAKKTASEAASKTWGANWAMLAQDIPQYLLLNKAFPKAAGKATRGTSKAMGKSGLIPTLSKGQAIGLDMLGEAGEEAYQYVVNEESRYLAEVNNGLRDESEFSGRLNDYLKDGEFWTSATIGALGAGVMQVGGKSLNTAITRIKGQESQEERRINNIKGWGAQRRYWEDQINARREVGDTEGALTAKDGLIRSMGIQAAQNENLGALRDSFESLASMEKLDENTAQLLDITEEEFPQVKKEAANYIKKLDLIENLYNENITKYSDDLAGEITNRQVHLADLESQKETIEPKIAKLTEDYAKLGKLSPKGEAIFEAELRKASLNKQLSIFKKRQAKDNNLNEEDNNKIAEEINEIETAITELDASIKEHQQDYKGKIKSDDNKIINEVRKTKRDQPLVDELIQKIVYKDLLNKTINDTKDRILQYQTKSFQKKFEEAKKQKDINNIKEAIDAALTPSEVSNVVNETKGTEAEQPVSNTITKGSNKENPAYPSAKDLLGAEEAGSETTEVVGNIPQIEAIYSSTETDSKDAILSFINDKNKIVKAARAKFKDNVNEEIQSVIDVLDASDNYADVQNILNNIYIQAIENEGDYIVLKDVIDTFYKGRAYRFEQRFKDQEKGTQEIVENDSTNKENKTPTTPEDFESASDRTQPFDITILQKELSDTKDPKDLKSIFSETSQKRLNWKLLNSSNKFNKDTEIEYEVVLDETHAPGKQGITKNNFQVQIISYKYSKKGHILGVLPNLDKVPVGTEGREELVALKELIWNKVKEHKAVSDSLIVKTGIKTTVSKKHAGRIWVTKEYYSPKQILEGTDRKIELAVVTMEGTDKKVIGYPDASDEFINNAKVGAVYMLVPNANGTIIPLRTFTRKIRDFNTGEKLLANKYKKEVYTKLLEIFNKGAKLAEISKELKQTVYLNFKVDYKALNNQGTLTLFKGNEPHIFNIKELQAPANNETKKKLSVFLDDLILQVDKNLINGFNKETGELFNDTIADRLKLNINPGEWIHSTRFTINKEYTEEEVPVEEASKPAEPVITVEEGSIPTPPDSSQDFNESVGEPVAPSEGMEGTVVTLGEKVEDKETIEEEIKEQDFGETEDGFDDIDEIEETKYRTSDDTSTKYELWDKETELTWFEKNFPEVDIKVLDNLNEVDKWGGEKAWGLFKAGVVYMKSTAKAGTTYHEAFHVVFNMYLNNKDKQAVLDEIKGDTKVTDLIAEELLADKFMDYMMSQEAIKPVGQRILDFFKRLYQIVKYKLTGNLNTDLLFRRMNNQYYVKPKFKRNIGAFRDVMRRRTPGLTYQEEFDRATNIADSMRRYIDKEFLNYPNKSRAEFLKDFLNAKNETTGELGIDIVLKKGLANLNGVYKKRLAANKLNSYNKKQFNVMMSNIFELNEEGTPVPEGQVTIKRLGDLALRQLALTEGLSIRTKATNFNGIDNPNDPENDDLNEEEVRLEGWQMKNIETSRRSSASSEVKKELSYMPVRNNKGKQLGDSIGLPKYHNSAETFATLIKEMADLYSSKEMIAKLTEFVQFRPEYKGILNKVKNDSKFRTQFYNAFQNTHAPFRIMIREFNKKENTYTYKWIHSNKATSTGIVDSWKNDYYNSDKNLLIDTEGNFKGNTELEALFGSLQSKTNKEDALDNMYKLLNSVGIEISMDELTTLANTEAKKDANLLHTFWKNINPILKYYFKGDNPYTQGREETKQLNTASYLLSKLREQTQESSLVNVSNKTVYSNILSFFVSKQVQALKNKDIRTKYLKDPFYKNLPWLRDMNSGLQKYDDFYNNQFEYTIMNGKKWDDDNSGTEYSDMSEGDLELVRYNAFMSADKYTWYQMPTLADAPTSLFIKNERLKEAEVVSELYQVALCEWARISSENNTEIVNYNDKLENKDKFHFIPVLNDHKALFEKVEDNKEQIKEIIKKYLDNKVINTKAKYEKLKIKDKLAKSKISYDANIKNYVYNSFFANTQMISLFQGDPAFYKNVTDFFKRAKEVWSPGTLLDTTATYEREDKDPITVKPKYTTIYSNDVEMFSTELADDILKGLLANKVNKIDAYSIVAKYGYSNANYIDATDEKDKKAAPIVTVDTNIATIKKTKDDEGKVIIKYYDKEDKLIKFIFENSTLPPSVFFFTQKTNVTDAQGFISLDRYREVQVGLGRWNYEYESNYNNLKQGTEVDTISMQPVKPFMFTHVFTENLVIPTQNKNSEFVLLPALAYRTKEGIKIPTEQDRLDKYSSYESPKLAMILDVMQRDSFTDNNLVDSVQFESAVKVGLYGKVDLDNLEAAVRHQLSNADYRLQQETPDHYTDDKGLIGTQLRKLIVSDISEEAIFTIEGIKDKYTKGKILEHYQAIVTADIIEGFNEVSERFKDVYEVQALLLEEVRKRGFNPELEEALEIDPKTKNFKLPLFHPLHSRRVEALLSSVFKNKVVRHKAPGGNLVQVTGVGFMNELKVVIKDNKLEEIQTMLPYWMKEKFSALMDENGRISSEKLKEHDLDRMIGYRIPTEDKYSMLPLRIVGFLPRESGGGIMLPPEITTITGSDFDVDKMFIHLPAMYTKRYDKAQAKRDFEKINNKVKGLDNLFELAEEDIITDNEVFNGWWQENKDKYLLDNPEIFKANYDSSKSALENTKDARNNAKLDIAWSILTNKDTFSRVIKPGNFDDLESLMKEVNDILNPEQNLDIADPLTSLTMFSRNMAGKALIGIFANHNVNHAILQHSNVYLEEDVSLNGTDASSMHSTKNEDDRYISGDLAQYLAAVVDNAKNPISAYLNINMFTADIIAYMTRLGFSMKTVIGFMNQPAIRELANSYILEGSTTDAYNTAYKDIKDSLLNKGAEVINSKDISQEDLFSYIKKQDNSEANNVQLTVLELFDRLRTDTFQLGKIVRVTRADNVNRQLTMASNEIIARDLRDLGEQETFVNIDSIWEGMPMMKTFYDNAVTNTSNELSKHFLWGNKALVDTKDIISKNLTDNKNLNQEQIERLNYDLLWYLVADYFKPNETVKGITRREYMVKEFPKDFTKCLEKNPELKSHALIKRLLTESKRVNSTPYNHVTFKNIGSLTDVDRANISKSWLDLLESEKHRNFAKHLVMYTMMTNGFHMTPKSFGHLIPVDYFSNLQNEKGESFNDKLRALQETTDTGVYEHFVGQFLRNNWQNEFYVPSIDVKNVPSKTIEDSMLLPRKKFKSFTSNLKKINGTMLEGKEKKFGAMFITVIKDGTKTLYGLDPVGTNNEFFRYVKTTPLGIKNISKEYSFEEKITSVFPSNLGIKPKKTVTTTVTATTSKGSKKNVQSKVQKPSESKMPEVTIEDMKAMAALGIQTMETPITKKDIDNAKDCPVKL